jgi:hypothetical protein
MSEWRDLFTRPTANEIGRKVSFRVLRRRGHDLLALPMENRAAARALTLYAAQTRAARLAKTVFHAALSCGLPVPLARVELAIAPTDPVFAWLQEMIGQAEAPLISVLAGNPFARGRRFIVLAFREGQPAIIAKLGTNLEARALVDRENRFLESFAQKTPHLPQWRGAKETTAWSGLALNFVEGRSPAITDTVGMLTVLRVWLDPTSPVSLDALAPWQRLKAHPDARPIIERAENRQVAPAIFHGDFAPWNVRVEKASRRWTVIDWERGESPGVPGWDWFHWMIHVSVLVHRHDTAQSVAFLDAALRSPAFQEYVAAAQIVDLERALLAGYLVYLHEFIVPPEIKDIIARLRDAVGAKL